MARIPKPVDGAKFCPLIGQSCIGEACMFWIGIWGKATPEAEPTLDWECSINWNVHLQRETLVETARVTAGHDKVATETNGLATLIAYGMRNRLPARDQSG